MARECGDGLPAPSGFGSASDAAQAGGGDSFSQGGNVSLQGGDIYGGNQVWAPDQRVMNDNRQLINLQVTVQQLQTTVQNLTTQVTNLQQVINNIDNGNNTQTIRQIAFGIANDAVALDYVAVWVPFREGS